jgi:hypothetical protein
MMDRLRRDSLWMGLFLGILFPAILFGVLEGLLAIVEHFTGKIDIVDIKKIILLSIVPNLFLLRYYLLKLKYDLTGRGILAATFVLGIVFAILEFTI